MSDNESAEVEGELDEEIYSSDSRDSVQPVVRRRYWQRIVTQNPTVDPDIGLGMIDDQSTDGDMEEADGDVATDVESVDSEEQPGEVIERMIFELQVARAMAEYEPPQEEQQLGDQQEPEQQPGDQQEPEPQLGDQQEPEQEPRDQLEPEPEPRNQQEPHQQPNDQQEPEQQANDNQELQIETADNQNPHPEPDAREDIPLPAAPILADPPPMPSPPSTSRQAQAQASVVISLDTPSPPKKRKRHSGSADKSLKKGSPDSKKNANPDDEDEGLTCPICMDSWEMSGEHRLVSLKCGHLFGEACIRRWLGESQRQSSAKLCPQCKAKASYRDIRHLYAKRIQMIDTDIKEQLEAEKRRTQNLITELATAKLSHTLTSEKLHALQKDYQRVLELLRTGGGRGAYAGDGGVGGQRGLHQLASHRLYMEKNFEITREPGCRVLLYSAKHSLLVASQKSGQNLFPGFGVRFIDPPTFKPLHFLHTSAMLVRDVAFSESQHLITVASREAKIKLFDIRSRLCSSMFSAYDKMLWSCALDRNEREHFLYTGDLRGGVYIYDLRFPENILSEFHPDENFSPVIHIITVPPNKNFSGGGFFVCQLTALTFYEYAAASEAAVATRLNVEGPFLSMQYDSVQDTVLISARSNASSPQSRFILGQLDKVDNTPVLKVKAIIYGSKATPIMTRPTQLAVENNTLVVGYLQDSKQLMMHDIRREERVQTMPVNEVIYDICPVATQAGSYLAALTDNKCRVYKVNSSKR